MMRINVTFNEFGTIFVEVDGKLVADSTTFNRKRGFWNKATKQLKFTPKFTPKKVEENPRMVIENLLATGTDVPCDAEVFFGGRV